PLTSFDTQSLAVQRFAPDTGDFINRTPGSTPAESQAEWTQISIRHTVGSGVPEIGHPIGVAFWAAADGAVDDAMLAVIPEPSTVVLAGIGGLILLACRRRE
ncbi:MAG: PEP-CTERM sorting domain-containing protein, partial [Pirellulales bacterium]|nr:PEP-CTERM sorting domain-containing protein [Pirellulales bacterium]